MNGFIRGVFFTLLTMNAWAEEPSSAAITNSVSRIQSTKESPKALFANIDFPIEENAFVRIEICVLKDGQFSMLWIDPRTQSPVAFVRNGEYFVFDVADNSMSFGIGLCPTLNIKATNEELSFDFAFSVAETKNAHATIDLNLPSILRSIDRQTVLVSSATETSLKHDSPSGETNVLWQFSPGLEPRLLGLTVAGNETGEMRFRIQDLNLDNDHTLRSFPSLDDFPGKRRPQKNVDSLFAGVQLITQILHATAGSAAIVDPKYRELDILANVTQWDEVEEKSALSQQWLQRNFLTETTKESSR